MEPFQVRLNCVDHYQATASDLDPPLPYRDGTPGKNDRSKVPVIRIFGATETGQKVCVHVHGAFPYLYVEYDGDLDPEKVSSAIKSLRLSIDQALAVSYNRNEHAKKIPFVAHITLVKGVPFYGYHVGYKFYFKIYLMNPIYMTRLADLLLQGAVLKRPLQPYESHLQFIPQWMCDYSLYGCAYMKCSKVKFRTPVPEYFELTDLSHRWHDRSISPEDLVDETFLPKQSHSLLEADVCVQDILNRSEISERSIHHDFAESLHPMASDERLVPSMAGLWLDETRRRKKRLGLEPGSSPFDPQELVSLSVDPRNLSKGGWIHEDEYRQMTEETVDEEKREYGGGSISHDDILSQKPFAEEVKTAMESVEDFYPDKNEISRFEQQSNPAETAEGMEVNASETTARAGPDGDPYISDDDDIPDIFSEESSVKEDVSEVEEDQDDDIVDLIQLGIDSDPQLKDLSRNNLILKHNPGLDELDIHGDQSIYPVSRKRKRYFDETPSQRLDSPGQHLRAGAVQVNETDKAQNAEDRFDGAKGVSSQGKPSESAVRPRGNDNGRLNFPVVKDPNDPMTRLRFSQDGGSSKEMQKVEGNSNAVSFLYNGSSQLKSSSPVTKSDIPYTLATEIASNIYAAFNLPVNTRIAFLQTSCPSPDEVSTTLHNYGYPSVVYQKAHYSVESDVPDRRRDYAGKDFRLEGSGIHFLPEFDPSGCSPAMVGEQPVIPRDKSDQEAIDQLLRESCTSRKWEYAPVPPSRAEVVKWLEERQAEEKSNISQPKETRPNVLSQIEGPTQQNEYGVEHQTHYMSIMSLELHVNTRGALSPNPEEDEISCDLDANGEDDRPDIKVSKALRIEWEYETTELDLINRVVDLVRWHDPDIITGYEVHSSSWGYLIERARKKYDFDICDELSRVKSQAHGRFGKDADRWGFNHTSSIRVTGRHMINIWRAMRSELNLLQYTMENVVFHLLHRRVPHYSYQDLTTWYRSGQPRHILKVVEYFVSRVQMDLEILESNELIPRTSEQARLLGIDFFSVFSRGSQFKPENFMLVSPSKKQVGQQNALECLPLVMEPQSDFYTSPVLVLDFQSLYPSIMIAYNYCYSTFLGRAHQWRGRNKMGFTDYKRQPRMLELLHDQINIAPNGMIYAKPSVRKSLLAKMLAEILETRVMVKNGMKIDKDDKTLHRLLNNRQLALKLIANVTYGYTSASFSGRMPCSEIADSIVQSGRETLEKAIAHIHSNPDWNAEVVYGDTDSLFIHLKGRTRSEAFTIGEEISASITSINPHPVKLKFEKVYHPCVLLSKKRYVGFKYEHASQTTPDFDAKGIETVRRDGTPAEQKIEEKALKLLFRTADLSQVKSYFQSQCTKIMQGRVSIQDFCFAREVRLGTYSNSDRALPPAGALISARKMVNDPRSEPQYGERVPYVVVTGAPGARLIDRCVAPETLLHDVHLSLDADYYITKNLIPPLERIFNLVGANVRQWYDEMPKVQRIRRVEGALPTTTSTITTTTTTNPSSTTTTTTLPTAPKKTLESYLKSLTCLICKSPMSRQRAAEKRVADVHQVCRSCMGASFGEEVRCDSKDCPVFYSRVRDEAGWRHTRAVLGPVVGVLQARERELEW
ncbi:DNA polymerase zeta catalytic subunit [Aspergillus heteromorphus CBS 117.55]|uniref:DNA polymerase n=1 Tax=Aspergillus heteromorphus CBS 117.55 TaxID=1448321 RepID=A0A317W6G0_9EURO|nr:DNA polymerase zeta catalytic subunit [Aspergillus heteromorphus CBS 117.55]PWY82204.1 DNA polymerase zeta catalytic subunit [Aspergillus heteromorphus CBS 117.55]